MSQPQLEFGGQSTSPSKPPLRLIFDERMSERNEAPREEPVEELVDVQLHPANPSKTTKVGALLPPNLMRDFENFLAENADVLA